MPNYTIQRGDTLSALAQRYGTTVQALAQANGISNPDRIQAGASIQVPGGPQPTTGAMPLPRPQQTTQASSAPLPPPNPQRGPVPLPRPRPEPVNSGMGSYNPAAPMNYAATANIQQQGQIAPPPPGSLTAGVMTPVIPAGWRPVPQGPGVPTTQRWTQNRPGGSVGSQDGDPDRAAIYDQPDITGAQRAQYAAERDMRTEPAPPPPWTPNGDAFLAAEQEMIRRQDEAARQAALAQPYTPPNLGALLTAAQNIGAGPPPELTPLEMARLGQLLRVRRDDTATMPAGVVPPRNLGALIAPGV